MKSLVLLFVGFVLLTIGLIIFATMDSPELNTLKYSLGLGLIGLGGLFLLMGIVIIIRSAKQMKKKIHIFNSGVETEGEVIYADKNYARLVNNTPIFSIVEYTYQDSSGNKYTRRVNSMSSEFVIRNQIGIGTAIAIKYEPEEPSKSVILLGSSEKIPFC